jgi:hypothetical protein
MNQHLPAGTEATEHRLVANDAYAEDPSLSYRPLKIQAWHLERRASVSIRQSTPQQVAAATPGRGSGCPRPVCRRWPSALKRRSRARSAEVEPLASVAPRDQLVGLNGKI